VSRLSVDTDTAALLDELARFPVPETEPTVDERRAALAFLADLWGPGLDSGPASAGKEGLRGGSLRIDSLAIPGPSGPIPLRLYLPEPPQRTRPPVVVHLHGGGWVLGDPDSYARVCRAYARASGCILVDVDYRRAPEHPFPAAINDCIAACDWVGRQARRLGGDPSRIILTGDSAGGNLAAATCLKTRTKLALQILVYPVIDARPDAVYASRQSLGGGDFFLREFDIKRAEREYLTPVSEGYKPLASPIAAPLKTLKRTPPTLILTAGFDPLRDEAIAYAARLDAAGVRVRHEEVAGTVHGFVLFAGRIEAGRKAIERIAHAIRTTEF